MQTFALLGCNCSQSTIHLQLRICNYCFSIFMCSLIVLALVLCWRNQEHRFHSFRLLKCFSIYLSVTSSKSDNGEPDISKRFTVLKHKLAPYSLTVKHSALYTLNVI
uniref:Uncharacterized protein n=1 Tax=Opuntia streptacantha TaxID=393608 RepID=A0A7C9A6L1_OPUST